MKGETRKGKTRGSHRKRQISLFLGKRGSRRKSKQVGRDLGGTILHQGARNNKAGSSPYIKVMGKGGEYTTKKKGKMQKKIKANLGRNSHAPALLWVQYMRERKRKDIGEIPVTLPESGVPFHQKKYLIASKGSTGDAFCPSKKTKEAFGPPQKGGQPR